MRRARDAAIRMTRTIFACLAWIAAFLILAGWLWPRDLGVICIALAFLGLLHLAVLVIEKITEPEFYEDMTPRDYEHLCAGILRKAQWSARVTPASGDQGVDVIAEKRGLRIVVQCKKYSKPVGNHAVQEIVAAIAHESARYGVVVTNSSFTAGARRLAASNRVLLLHHSELIRIDRLLRG